VAENEKGSLYLKVLNGIYKHFTTHNYLTSEQLAEIISKVIAKNNAFEQLDECSFFDATQIY